MGKCKTSQKQKYNKKEKEEKVIANENYTESNLQIKNVTGFVKKRGRNLGRK